MQWAGIRSRYSKNFTGSMHFHDVLTSRSRANGGH